MEKQHQLFVQGIKSRKTLNIKEFSDLYEACLEEADGLTDTSTRPETINRFLSIIRNALKNLDCDIQKCFDESTGNCCYVWVVTREREWCTTISAFTIPQSAYFMKLLEEIITSDHGFINSTRALNVTNEMEDQHMTKTAAESTIKLLEKFGFLGTDDGRIYLGVAGLAEFNKYLKDNYEDYLHCCDQCEKIVVYGTQCRGCDNRFHRYCLQRYISSVKRNECPKCQSHLSDV
ncbi:Non-structural maintenance of chromosomes element 1 [Chamberlinius hualienensis]